MFTSVKNFVKRNRTNIAIGVGLAGAAYVYARSKFSETKDRMTSDRIAKENLKRRFEQNQDDCSLTVLELLPTAVDAIMRDLPVEKITQELQQKKAVKLARASQGTGESSAADTPSPMSTPIPGASPSPAKDDDNQSLQSFASESYIMANGFSVDSPRRGKSRTQLWSEIKIGSLTRGFTLIYTLALLTILTRVQLNLLGRKNYLSSVVSLAARDEDPTITLINNDSLKASASDDEVNRQYLIFSWWFLNKGWRRVRDRVETAVKEVFGPYTPRDTITLPQLRELTGRVRRMIEVDDGANPSVRWITSYLLPSRSEEHLVFTESGYTQQPIASSSSAPPPPQQFQITPALRKMLDETSDLLDSPIAAIVMRTMLDIGFGMLVEEKMLEQAFKKQSSMPSTPQPSTPGSAMGSGVPTISITAPVGAEEIPSTKLASVLATVTREAQMIGSRLPNEYLRAMEQAKELEGFSALVYSNFEDVTQLNQDRDDSSSEGFMR